MMNIQILNDLIFWCKNQVNPIQSLPIIHVLGSGPGWVKYLNIDLFLSLVSLSVLNQVHGRPWQADCSSSSPASPDASQTSPDLGLGSSVLEETSPGAQSVSVEQPLTVTGSELKPPQLINFIDMARLARIGVPLSVRQQSFRVGW